MNVRFTLTCLLSIYFCAVCPFSLALLWEGPGEAANVVAVCVITV